MKNRKPPNSKHFTAKHAEIVSFLALFKIEFENFPIKTEFCRQQILISAYAYTYMIRGGCA